MKLSIGKADFPHVSVVIYDVAHQVPHGGLPFVPQDLSDTLVKIPLQIGLFSSQLVTMIRKGK